MASNFYHEDTPSEIKDAKGLHLITTSTPNGKKVQIMLEELREVYATEFTHTLISLPTNDQKKDWFLKLNPNGRIPVLVDNTKSPPFPVIETSAIMLYLLKQFDSKDTFGFKDELERSQCLQWLLFWHGSGQPIEGQLNWFGKLAPEKDEFAINRFKKETLRIFGVLEIHLSGKYTNEPRQYLAGTGQGKYSIADMGAWPWVSGYDFSGQITEDEMKDFPHLLMWVKRIADRPAVKKGTAKSYQNW
ncbi:related to URE2-nitrogen catabolite repression regulator [Rhynchosporium graminicola]|uniref:Related to URE2-nitrogen catabolite repression regulator n=1 Tax=Rhynchosporium graminicola TaxID=2792576 RepID=A0A1E1LLN8_9HELO|nr:related to URE2-nitrogen catabolite repression regulator [Rhynchosporium commune]